MSKYNKSSYFPLSMLSKSAQQGVFFGPTTFANERDGIYPDRVLKEGATVIWIPSKKKSISIASYYDAQKNNDAAALETFKDCGVPLGIDFGVGTDLTSTYTVKKQSARSATGKKRELPVKVMRAKFGSYYEDGTKFNAGDVVKIRFRAKFVSDAGGTKKFQNEYTKPTAEELAKFLQSEQG